MHWALHRRVSCPLPDYITIDNNCAIINTTGFIIHSQKDIDAFPSIHRVSNNKDIHDLTFYIKDNSIIFERCCQFKNVNIISKEGGVINCRIDSYGYDINNIAELNFIGSDKNVLTFRNPGITQKDGVKIPFENKYNDFIRHAKRLRVRYINFAYYLDENPTYIYYELKNDSYVLITKWGLITHKNISNFNQNRPRYINLYRACFSLLNQVYILEYHQKHTQ